MIQHIVFMSFQPDAMPDAAQRIRDQLQTLPAQIPEIQRYEIGLNIVEAERNDDLVLISAFASLDDLRTYSQHPAHQAVVQEILKVATSIRAVDYETDG